MGHVTTFTRKPHVFKNEISIYYNYVVLNKVRFVSGYKNFGQLKTCSTSTYESLLLPIGSLSLDVVRSPLGADTPPEPLLISDIATGVALVVEPVPPLEAPPTAPSPPDKNCTMYITNYCQLPKHHIMGIS